MKRLLRQCKTQHWCTVLSDDITKRTWLTEDTLRATSSGAVYENGLLYKDLEKKKTHCLSCEALKLSKNTLYIRRVFFSFYTCCRLEINSYNLKLSLLTFLKLVFIHSALAETVILHLLPLCTFRVPTGPLSRLSIAYIYKDQNQPGNVPHSKWDWP